MKRVPMLMPSAPSANAATRPRPSPKPPEAIRSEEHTSELQSRLHLVCRLLLEKKKKKKDHNVTLLSFIIYPSSLRAPKVTQTNCLVVIAQVKHTQDCLHSGTSLDTTYVITPPA